MIIGVVKEAFPGETRVAATPATVVELLKLGYEVVVEPGAGRWRRAFPTRRMCEAGASVGDRAGGGHRVRGERAVGGAAGRAA